MKLAATTANANIHPQSLKAISNDRDKPMTTDNSPRLSLAARFWAYTEETGKADTTSFEGLL